MYRYMFRHLSLCFETSRRNMGAGKHVPLYVPPSLSVLWDLTAEYGGGKICTVICAAISLSVLWNLKAEIGIFFWSPFISSSAFVTVLSFVFRTALLGLSF